MRPQEFDLFTIRKILWTSQGFSLPLLPDPKSPKKPHCPPNRLKPPGHPISKHVRGASNTKGENKTKFCTLNDQAQALLFYLRSEEGVDVISKLRPHVPATPTFPFRPPCPIQAEIPDIGFITLPTNVLEYIGHKWLGFAKFECRVRHNSEHLHVQTCYPILDTDSTMKAYIALTTHTEGRV